MSGLIKPAKLTNTSSNGHYAIICGHYIYPNSVYKVLVSVHNVKSTCKLELSLEGPNFEQRQELIIEPPTTMKQLDFEIPNIADCNSYNIIAKGIEGLIFNETANLDYRCIKPAVYVQTDKATYKPGDLVRFRVVFLDENTRPAKLTKPVVIYVQDAERNRIKQFNDVTAPKGVFSAQLQLSEFPVLGEWSVEVQIDGSTETTKCFDVDKYVLPKFEVLLDAPKKVFCEDEKIGFNVRAKYTFGKNVKGKATVTVKNMPQPRFSCIAPQTPDVETKLQSVVDFDGKAFVEFNLTDLVSNTIQYDTDYQVITSLEEELTGVVKETETKITIVPYRFNIEMPYITLDYDEAQKPYKYEVTIKNLNDEPETDPKHLVKFRRSFNLKAFEEVQAQLNEFGVASIEVDCKKYDMFNIEVEYRGQLARGHISRSHRTEPQKGLQVKTKNPTLGKPLEMSLRTADAIEWYVYAIVARGKIIQSALISLDTPASSVSFQIEPSFEMIPRAAACVYYIKDGTFTCNELRFDVHKQFVNNLSIEAPTQTSPGADIELQLQTTVDSFVGLMAVDQSVLLLKSGNDFDANEIFDKLNVGDELGFYSDYDLGKRTGIEIMTNATWPKRPVMNTIFGARRFQNIDAVGGELYALSSPVKFGGVSVGATAMCKRSIQLESAALPAEPPSPPRVRTQFLESWFFEDIESTSKKITRLSKQIPDTITSWIVTGFTLNPNNGFALSDQPTKIQTFRPFFISTNLPYAIKRGETVNIPVILFNYMEQPLEAEITLKNADNEFEFVGSDADASAESKLRVKRITAASNNGAVVTFAIRAKQIGQISLCISAISALAGDAIDKKLRVEPEGVTIYKNRDFYLHAPANGEHFGHKQLLDIPEDIVPDSEHIEVSVMGDILASTISNLDELVRMPYGCGEQNMVNFVPNILVLCYLKSMKRQSSTIESRARSYMELGYQRELTYKHNDGSYSAFGISDKSGSTWLTAYVMRSFQQAAAYMQIDSKVLDAGLQFLASKQTSDGGFREDGKLFDFAHCNKLGLAAFVLLAFMENDERQKQYASVIERGVKFLEECIEASDDLYGRVIALYTLQLCKSSVVTKVLPALEAQAKMENGLRWWSKAKEPEQCSRMCWRPRSNDVELTSYVLMTLLELNTPSVLPIAKWLVAQRNSKGGFESTQDTVVGLQALIKFAEKMRAGDTQLEIAVSGDGATGKVGAWQVQRENALITQTLQMPKQTREVNFEGSGVGVAILQAAYRYNMLKSVDEQSFKLTTNVKSKPQAVKLVLEVAVEYVPSTTDGGVAAAASDVKPRSESNMVVLELMLPSGYTFSASDCDALRAVQDVKRVETKKDDTQIIVYFDSLKQGVVKCLPIEAERAHEVSDQKPVSVVVYDYYDSQQRATVFYQI